MSTTTKRGEEIENNQISAGSNQNWRVCFLVEIFKHEHILFLHEKQLLYF